MKNVALPFLFLLVPLMATTAQQAGQPEKKALAPRAMCDAAALKLHESGTNEVVLIMTVDSRGKVASFQTESPKGLRLEKMKEAAAAIKALQFEPARKNGQPVPVMVRVEFDCSNPAIDGKKKPQP